MSGEIASDFYVDNWLASFDDELEGAKVGQQLVKLLSTGGFELTQFLSSSRAVLDPLPASIRIAPELGMDLEGLPTERTLGYLWNCQLDAFVF